MLRIFTTIFLFYCIAVAATAQNVKIKKGVILLDKNPAYQIKEGEKLDRFETYVFSDLDGKEVLVAAPKYYEFVQLRHEEKPYKMPYYEVRLSDGTVVTETEFVPIGYRKRLVNYLVAQKVLGTDAVGSTLADTSVELTFTPEERKKIEGYNENRKSFAKSEPFRMYSSKWLVDRNPNFNFDQSELYFKVGTTPVAYAKLAEANIGSGFYRYEILSTKKTTMLSSGRPLIATIFFQKADKEFRVVRAFDKSEFSFQVDDFFNERYFERIAFQLFLEGLL